MLMFFVIVIIYTEEKQSQICLAQGADHNYTEIRSKQLQTAIHLTASYSGLSWG